MSLNVFLLAFGLCVVSFLQKTWPLQPLDHSLARFRQFSYLVRFRKTWQFNYITTSVTFETTDKIRFFFLKVASLLLFRTNVLFLSRHNTVLIPWLGLHTTTTWLGLGTSLGCLKYIFLLPQLGMDESQVSSKISSGVTWTVVGHLATFLACHHHPYPLHFQIWRCE